MAPLPHAERRALPGGPAGVGGVAQLVEPVLLSCDEEVPRQEGADPQQEEDDVHQEVGVRWAVTGRQGPRGRLLGQERGPVHTLLLLLRQEGAVRRRRWDIGGVEAAAQRFCRVHLLHTQTGAQRDRGREEGDVEGERRGDWRGREIEREKKDGTEKEGKEKQGEKVKGGGGGGGSWGSSE